MNIENIDLRLAVWLVAPAMEYHWRGVSVYGNAYDAIGDVRNEIAKPTEVALLSVVDATNCAAYPSIVDWDALDHSLTVSASATVIGVGDTTTIDSVSANDCVYVLFDDGVLDSAGDLAGGDTMVFGNAEAGVYRIVFIDTVTFATGVIEISVE